MSKTVLVMDAPISCSFCKLRYNNRCFAENGHRIEEKHSIPDWCPLQPLSEEKNYKKQYLNNPEDPLEPLKLSSALNSQTCALEYRKKHAPEEISVLDYTIIYALEECLVRRLEDE